MLASSRRIAAPGGRKKTGRILARQSKATAMLQRQETG
jgi:hypothetical protein